MLKIFNSVTCRYILSCIVLLVFSEAFGQPGKNLQYMELALNKTSTIVFDSPITSVDRGSRDVLAQKAKGVTNVLQLKAGRENFRETNLTVITADGILHHFIVRYSESPATLTFDRRKIPQGESSGALMLQDQVNEQALQQQTEYILAHPPRSHLKAIARNKMKLRLLGIYIRENTMFYLIRISNASNIAFHIDMLRFSVRDKQQVKRTASQEVGEDPLYIAGNTETVPAKGSIDLVYALPKFTIPDAKRLYIELLERKGGRHLQMHVTNKKIMKARPIP